MSGGAAPFAAAFTKAKRDDALAPEILKPFSSIFRAEAIEPYRPK